MCIPAVSISSFFQLAWKYVIKKNQNIKFQNIFPALPEHATLTRAECTFDRNSCAWRNTSTGDFEWRMAAVARRPANLLDKTYGAPVGYAYFDIFNTGARLEYFHLSFTFLVLLF